MQAALTCLQKIRYKEQAIFGKRGKNICIVCYHIAGCNCKISCLLVWQKAKHTLKKTTSKVIDEARVCIVS